MRRVTQLFLVVLAAAAPSGCSSSDKTASDDGGVDDGGTAAATSYYKSGSRLRARVVRGDGPPLFEGFVDTQEQVDCEFVETPDGTMRCLPARIDFVYLDDKCTQPAAKVDDCTAGSAFAAASELTGACGAAPRVTELRAIEASLPAAPYWVRALDGSCTMTTLASGESLRGVGAPIDLTGYVGAHAVDETPAPSLRRQRLVADDGSELALPGLTDVARDAGCSPQRLAPPDTPLTPPAAMYCIPAVAYADPSYGPFADASCTQPAANATQSDACPAPTAVLRIDAPKNPACGTGYGFSLFELGAPLAASYRLAGGTCSANPASTRAFAIGPAFALDTLPALTRALSGDGRVRLLAVTAGGAPLDRGELWDDTAQTTCQPQPFDDGKLYCVPPGNVTTTSPVTAYKDAGCTQPIFITSAQSCYASKVLIMGALTCNGGAYEAMVRPIGDMLTITEYYEDLGGCSATPKPLAAGSVAYDLMPAVPASTRFAEVTRATE